LNPLPSESVAPTTATEQHARFLEYPRVHLVMIVIVGLFAYANSFRVPFVFDDLREISENPVIRSLANFFLNGSGYEYSPNRYIGYLSFALNYHFGGLDVVGYHVVNLGIHIANALLVYSLVRLTFRTPFFSPLSERRSSPIPRLPLFIALLTALLFVCHPIQTQAVTYIVQRLTSLATLFYLAALVLHVRWRLAREAGSPFLSGAVLPPYLLSLAAAVLAMKTKEIAFTLPLIVLLYEFCFFGRPDRKRFMALLPMLLTICIIPLAMVSLSKPLGELLSDMRETTVLFSRLSRWEYLFTQFSVIATYLRLLLLPVNQNLDYDYPVSHSLSEPRAILSLLLLLALFGLALYLWRAGARCRREGTGGNGQESSSSLIPQPSYFSTQPLLRLAAFGIIWYFITLMVESSFVPIIDVIFEHRVYLPSVGFFLALATFLVVMIHTLAQRDPSHVKWPVAILLLITVILSIATINRNRVWSSSLSLWEDTVRKSPGKGRPHKNLGLAYGSLGNFAMAKKERQIYDLIESKNLALQDPNNAQVRYHLGNIYREQGLYVDAIQEYLEAIRLKPDHAKAHSDLGLVYALQGRLAEAIAEFRTATALDPGNQIMRDNLHNLLKQQTQRK